MGDIGVHFNVGKHKPPKLFKIALDHLDDNCLIPCQIVTITKDPYAFKCDFERLEFICKIHLYFY